MAKITVALFLNLLLVDAARAAAGGAAQAVPAGAHSAAALFANEFSATVVHQPPPGIPKAQNRLFGGPERLRVESSLGFISMTRIFDRSKPLYLTLFPTNRTYRESVPTAIESLARADLERYATAADGNPCAWKQEATCVAASEEQVIGRRARRWEAKFKNGKSGTYWVDLELRLILRAQDPTFSFEIKDLKLAPQAAELFVPPSNYKRAK